MFVALGWRGAMAHYGAHGVNVRRWMLEEGWDGIVAERAAHRRRQQQQERAFRHQMAVREIAAASRHHPRTHQQQEAPTA